MVFTGWFDNNWLLHLLLLEQTIRNQLLSNFSNDWVKPQFGFDSMVQWVQLVYSTWVRLVLFFSSLQLSIFSICCTTDCHQKYSMFLFCFHCCVSLWWFEHHVIFFSIWVANRTYYHECHWFYRVFWIAVFTVFFLLLLLIQCHLLRIYFEPFIYLY